MTYLDGGTLSFTLAVAIEAADNLIVVDAAELHAEPGRVRTFIGPDMDRFLGAARRTVHEVALIDLLDIARLTESLPANRALVGIQPGEITWGNGPTQRVTDCIPEAAATVVELARAWHP
jgi:hydrogenase maturation protease